jgi:TPR repeat protein
MAASSVSLYSVKHKIVIYDYPLSAITIKFLDDLLKDAQSEHISEAISASAVLGWIMVYVYGVAAPDLSHLTQESFAHQLIEKLGKDSLKSWVIPKIGNLLYGVIRTLWLGKEGHYIIFNYLLQLKESFPKPDLELFYQGVTLKMMKEMFTTVAPDVRRDRNEMNEGISLQQLMISEELLTGKAQSIFPSNLSFFPTLESWERVALRNPLLAHNKFNFTAAVNFRQNRAEIVGQRLHQFYLNRENKLVKEETSEGCFYKVLDLYQSNPKEAYSYLNKAADQGNLNAKYIRALLMLRVKHEQSVDIPFLYEQEGMARDVIAETLLSDRDVRHQLDLIVYNPETMSVEQLKDVINNCVQCEFQEVPRGAELNNEDIFLLIKENAISIEEVLKFSSPSSRGKEALRELYDNDIRYGKLVATLINNQNNKNSDIYRAALNKLKKLANKNHGSSQFAYGVELVDTQPVKAFEWIEAAFRNGNRGAHILIFVLVNLANEHHMNINPYVILARKLINANLKLIKERYENCDEKPSDQHLELKTDLKKLPPYFFVQRRAVTQKKTASVAKKTTLKPLSSASSSSYVKMTMADAKQAAPSVSSAPTEIKNVTKTPQTLDAKQIAETVIDSTIRSLSESIDLFPTLARDYQSGLDVNIVIAYVIYLTHFREPPLLGKRLNIFFNPKLSPEYQMAHQILQASGYRERCRVYDNPESMRYAKEQLFRHIDNVSSKKNKRYTTKERAARDHALKIDVPSTKKQIEENIDAYRAKKVSQLVSNPPKDVHLNSIFSRPAKVMISEEKVSITLMQTLSAIMELSYQGTAISDVILAQIKANLSSLAKSEKSSELWDLICKGLMDGRGEIFFSHLRKLELFDILFPPTHGEEKRNSEHTLDHFAERIRYFNEIAQERRSSPASHGYLFTGILIAKELKEEEPVSQDAIDTVIEAYKIPLDFLHKKNPKDLRPFANNQDYNAVFLGRVSKEKQRFSAAKKDAYRISCRP